MRRPPRRSAATRFAESNALPLSCMPGTTREAKERLSRQASLTGGSEIAALRRRKGASSRGAIGAPVRPDR
jgi:hypothetical protein